MRPGAPWERRHPCRRFSNHNPPPDPNLHSVSPFVFPQAYLRAKCFGKHPAVQVVPLFSRGQDPARFQNQHVRKPRHDFFDVMGDEDECGRVFAAADAL